MRIKFNLIGGQMPKPLGYTFLHRVGCLLCFTWRKVPSWTLAFSQLEDLFWTTYQPTTGFPNLLQVALAPLPCLTSTWARAPPHPPPSPLWWTLLPPWCLCHWGLAHRGNLNKSTLLIFSGSQLWLQHVGEYQQDGLGACSTSCWPWWSSRVMMMISMTFWWWWCRCCWWC